MHKGAAVSAADDRVRGVVGPVVAAAGLDLESLQVSAAGRRRLLRVVVDADEGVSLDTVAEVSQRLSQALDDTDAMGGQPYVLEVSSPGTDRPLTEPRHWRRAVGRLVEVRLVAGGALEGRVVGADDDGVDLLVDRQARRLAYPEVARAVVQVEFSRLGAADDGADANGEG